VARTRNRQGLPEPCAFGRRASTIPTGPRCSNAPGSRLACRRGKSGANPVLPMQRVVWPSPGRGGPTVVLRSKSPDMTLRRFPPLTCPTWSPTWPPRSPTTATSSRPASHEPTPAPRNDPAAASAPRNPPTGHHSPHGPRSSPGDYACQARVNAIAPKRRPVRSRRCGRVLTCHRRRRTGKFGEHGGFLVRVPRLKAQVMRGPVPPHFRDAVAHLRWTKTQRDLYLAPSSDDVRSHPHSSGGTHEQIGARRRGRGRTPHP
jgi:hypothetical protein